jgi:3-oxoacyl-[acyl-carrier protein] reductase
LSIELFLHSFSYNPKRDYLPVQKRKQTDFINNDTMLLQNKNAIVYGAGGSIGGAVAKAFAKDGAKVFLTGRTVEKLDAVAKEIVDNGGRAETAVVDALDENSINNYLTKIVNEGNQPDISFNAVGLEDVQGTPLIEMSFEDYMRPISIAVKTQFLTAKAVAPHMIKNGSGVILCITAIPAGKAYANVGGFGPACSAMEGFARNLAAEIGPSGVRVVCLRSAGSPDSDVFIKAIANGGTPAKTSFDSLVNDTMLKRLPLMNDIANVAAFVASDKATCMTGTAVNVTCGATIF